MLTSPSRLEGGLTLTGPLELHTLPGKRLQRACHLGEIRHESAIIRTKSQESPNLRQVLWMREVCNSSCEPGVGLQILWGHHVPQVLHFLSYEATLARLQLQPSITDALDNMTEMHQVVIKSAREYQNIIYVHGDIVHLLGLGRLTPSP